MAEAEQRAKVGVDHGGSLAPTDFEGMYRMATAFAKSQIVPKAYQNKPEDILVAWEYGAELGLGKMQSLQSITVINSKPTLPGETLLAIAYASGELEDYEETWDSLKKVATATAKRKGRKPITHTFSWADAERIKTFEHGQQVSLASKDTYRNYPQRMCTMRARGFALRDAFADKIKGLKTSEEMEEVFDDEALASKAKTVDPRIPDLEKKPEPITVEQTDKAPGPDDGLREPSEGSAEVGGSDSPPVSPETKKVVQEAAQQATVDTIIARINAMTAENFDAEEKKILGKDVFGKLASADEKLAVTMAVNRKRRELFPR